jgi:2-amino-4-hydroxy-6-hydroxymethyldihydropteridine diphosphokinase
VKTYSVFIGIGSNVGDRFKHLVDAAREIKNLPETRYVWSSSVYDTDPWGKPEQPRFLNAVIEVETSLEPAVLLPKLKEIETRLGRTSSEPWGPREIDCDILIYDGLVQRDELVQVPHVDLEERRFVLVPLREIAPGLVHPITGMTMEQLASFCSDRGKVLMTSYKINV